MNRRYLPLVGALLILISVSAIRAAVIVKSRTGQCGQSGREGQDHPRTIQVG